MEKGGRGELWLLRKHLLDDFEFAFEFSSFDEELDEFLFGVVGGWVYSLATLLFGGRV